MSILSLTIICIVFLKFLVLLRVVRRLAGFEPIFEAIDAICRYVGALSHDGSTERAAKKPDDTKEASNRLESGNVHFNTAKVTGCLAMADLNSLQSKVLHINL